MTPTPNRRPYPEEFRARAVELARSSGLEPAQLARDLGIDRDTLRRWLRQAEVDAGERAGIRTDERAELAPVAPRERAPERGARDLAQSDPVFRTHERDVTNWYQFVADQAAHHPVRLVCRAVGVSRSGSSAWRRRSPSARALADQALTEQIRAVHQASRQTDGRRRVPVDLREHGQAVGCRRVARLMRHAGLRGHGRAG